MEESGPSPKAGLVILNQLRTDGKITQSQYVLYYNRYMKLTQVVQATLKSEGNLLSRVNDFEEQTAEAKRRLAEETAMLNDQEEVVGKAWKELMEQSKTLRAVDQESDILTLTIESLERTNAQNEEELEAKIERNAKDLEPRLADLRERVDELTKHIEEYETQLEQGQVDRKDNEKLIDDLKQEIEDLKIVAAKNKKKLVAVKAEPEQIKIKTEVTARKMRQLQEHVEKLCKENEGKEVELEALRERKRTMEDNLEFVGNQLIDLREEIQQKQSEISDLKKRVDQEKLKAKSLVEKRLQTSSDLAKSKEKLKSETQAVVQSQKSFVTLKKVYEKRRRERENSMEAISKLNDERQQVDNMVTDLSKANAAMEKSLEELYRNFEISMVAYLDDTKSRKVAEEALLEMQARVKQLKDTQDTLVTANEELQEEIIQLRADRKKLLKDTNALHIAHKSDEHLLKEKQLLTMDLKRKDELAKARLVELRTLYNTVKKSKNRFATLAANSNQALAEMKEKIKIVHNECEILKNESLSKDRALIEEARILNSAKHTRDVLRLEQLSIQKEFKELNELGRTQSMDIDKLQSIIKGIDLEMIRIRESFKAASEKRNKTGLSVIHRNDEMCVLHEKKSILEEILQKGTRKIQELETELKAADVELASVVSQIKGTEKNLPSSREQKEVEKRFYELKGQIAEQEALFGSLSAQLDEWEPAENPGRFRKIEGKDPAPKELKKKISNLEKRLQRQREQAESKEMVLRELQMLTEKAQSQFEECGENTLELAKKMNELQTKEKTLTRKLMSVISELSMYQATAIQLEEDLQEKRNEFRNGQVRLSNSNPPSERAINQWLRIQRDRIYKADMIKSSFEISADYMVQTRCEQRPTAYIDPTMGIPRPYGAKAPFKPTQLGSNMRHIRKPETLAPID